MAEVFFFLAGLGAIAGAVAVVVSRNQFYSVLALIVHLLSLAALFLLLRAQFVAAAQVVVYAGAVMVLYLFVVAYIGGGDEPLRAGDGAGLRIVSTLAAGSLFLVIFLAIVGSGLDALGDEGAPFEAVFGTPRQIGELLLTKFLLAFEVASFLLLIAAVGAVVLARRRGAMDAGGTGRISVADLVRPAGTGTMKEAAGAEIATPGDRLVGPGRPGDGDQPPAGAGAGAGKGGW